MCVSVHRNDVELSDVLSDLTQIQPVSYE